MPGQTKTELRLADRLWIAVALLHRANPERVDFTKDEIRSKLHETKLDDEIEMGSVSAHLKEHLVANVPPSSSKYRMLFETRNGNLRLYRPSDAAGVDPGRIQRRRPSKTIPNRDEIPSTYWPLLDWYASWSAQAPRRLAPISYEDDPLIRLVGSGKHIWSDEHADEYVENLRREDR